MNVGTTSRYQQRLANKKQGPQSEHSAMNMRQSGQLRRANNAFQVVGPREPDKNTDCQSKRSGSVEDVAAEIGFSNRL